MASRMDGLVPVEFTLRTRAGSSVRNAVAMIAAVVILAGAVAIARGPLVPAPVQAAGAGTTVSLPSAATALAAATPSPTPIADLAPVAHAIGVGDVASLWTETSQTFQNADGTQTTEIFGLIAHHDLTWTAGSTGPVSGTVRYDPAGTATSVTGSVPAFRFQGSWADDVTRLSWVVTRWYAPAQGRLISEDSLLGEPRDPDSRHLYAYGAGDPVGAWDQQELVTQSVAESDESAGERDEKKPWPPPVPVFVP